MTEILLPFGLRLADQRMVAVAAVERGLACDCVCPACSSRLMAIKGEVYRHHFRHAVEGVDCQWARETALHKFAKQIICERLWLTLPHAYNGLGKMLSAAQEVDLGGIRPDVVAQYERDTVAVEIYVAHRVPPEKVRKICERALATVEVDLSYYRDADMTEAELQKAVLDQASRRWIYEPKPMREAREAELAALGEAAREAAAKAAEAEAQWRKAEADRAQAWALERKQKEAERAVVEAQELARRHEAREGAAMAAATAETMRRQRAADRAPPDLQKLIAAYGGYSSITAEAWARWDEDCRRWHAMVRAGGLHD